MQEVARLKLVKPEFQDIEKGTDGLFRRKDGEVAELDATAKESFKVRHKANNSSRIPF